MKNMKTSRDKWVHSTIATVVEFLARKRCSESMRGLASHVGIDKDDVGFIISEAQRLGLIDKNGRLIREVPYEDPS